MQGIYPEVGTSGVITVAEPYRTVFTDRVLYECIAVESLDGIILQGFAPFEEFYEPYGIRGDVYEEDLVLNGKIVTFRTTDGHTYKIPNRFIETLPHADGVVYQGMAIGITLGIVAEQQDLDSIQKEIEELILVRTGITCNIQSVVTGSDVLLTHDQDNAIRVTRQEMAKNNSSYLLQLDEMKSQNEELSRYCGLMEATLEELKAEVERLKAA